MSQTEDGEFREVVTRNGYTIENSKFPTGVVRVVDESGEVLRDWSKVGTPPSTVEKFAKEWLDGYIEGQVSDSRA